MRLDASFIVYVSGLFFWLEYLQDKIINNKHSNYELTKSI